MARRLWDKHWGLMLSIAFICFFLLQMMISVKAAESESDKLLIGTASNCNHVQQQNSLSVPALEVVTELIDGSQYEYDDDVPIEGTVLITLTSDREVDFYYQWTDVRSEKLVRYHHHKPYRKNSQIDKVEDNEAGWMLLADENYLILSESLHRSYIFKAVAKEDKLAVAVSAEYPIHIRNINYQPVAVEVMVDGVPFERIWTNRAIEVYPKGGIASEDIAFLAGYEYCFGEEAELLENQWWRFIEFESGVQPVLILDEEFDCSYLWIRPVSIFGGRGEPDHCQILIGIDRQKPEGLLIQYGDADAREIDWDYPHFITTKVTTIQFSAVDNSSGIAGYYYRLEAFQGETVTGFAEVDSLAEPFSYQASITVDKEFAGRLGIAFQDQAGNWFVEEAYLYDGFFTVEIFSPLPPLVYLTTNEVHYTGEWTKADVVVSLQDGGSFSGADYYQYVVTEGEQPSETALWEKIGGELRISFDIDKTYYFRTVSKGGLIGECSDRYKIRVQKSLPFNAIVDIMGTGIDSWYREKPNITIIESNKGSESIPYSIYFKIWDYDDMEPKDYQCYQKSGILIGKVPEILTEGHYWLRVWTEDEAGNRNAEEEDVLLEFGFDQTPPQLTLSYRDNGEGIYYRENRVGILVIEDKNFSPVDLQVIYAEASGQVQLQKEYHKEDERFFFYLDFLSEELGTSYHFFIQATDLAGNVTESITQEFMIDCKSPIANFTRLEEDIPAWQRVVEFEVQSGLSGFRTIVLLKDDIYNKTLFTDNSNGLFQEDNQTNQWFSVIIKENGNYSLNIETKSGLSRIIPIVSYQSIDHQKPVIRVDSNGYQQGIWSSAVVSLEVENITANLGDTVFYYRVGGGEWEVFDGLLILREDVEATYYFMAKSEAQYSFEQEMGEAFNYDSEFRSSSCTPRSFSVKIDRTYPENLRVEYDLKEAKPFLNMLTFGFFFKDSLTVHLRADDEISGIKYFDVLLKSLAGQEEKKRVYVENSESGKGYASFTMNPQFIGTILVSATDYSGLSIPQNGMTRYESLAVDSLAPTAPVINSGAYQAGKWTNQSLKITVTGAMAETGVKGYEYTMTNGGIPDERSLWHSMAVLEQQEGTVLVPESVLGASLDIAEDSNGVYYFRGVSNSGLTGQMVSMAVKVRKTLPEPPVIVMASENQTGWYQNIPEIKIIQDEYCSIPIQYYYQLLDLYDRNKIITEGYWQEKLISEFLQDGEYHLKIWTEDEAGNRSLLEADFLKDIKLDTTPPVVGIYVNGQVINGTKYYNDEVHIEVRVDEKNLDENQALLKIVNEKGQMLDFTSAKSTSGCSFYSQLSLNGEYQISLSAQDVAGHESEVCEVMVVVDKNAPMILVEGVGRRSANPNGVEAKVLFLDDYLDFEKTELQLISTLQNNSISIPVMNQNGRGIGFLDITEDDVYTLKMEVWDLAGNYHNDKYVFSVNQQGPVLLFEPAEYIGGYVTKPFRPMIEVWDIDLVTVISLTLNGCEVSYDFFDGKIIFEEEISKEGKYIIALDVRDGAGHYKMMDEVTFYFDDVPPEIIIKGVTNSGYYRNEVVVEILLENHNDFLTGLWLNGEMIDDDFRQNNVVSFKVDEAGSYLFQVQAEDQAGNITLSEPITFQIGNNVLRTWLNALIEFLWRKN